MTIEVYMLPFSWRHVTQHGMSGEEALELEARIAEVFASWKGTPYLPGQCRKGRDGGVDCVRFVASVLDELSGCPMAHEIPRLPQDVSLHDAGTAKALMRTIMRWYGMRRVEDGFAEPGDIIMVGMAGAGPGHAQIVGTRRNTLFEGVRPEVQMSGWIWYGGTEIHGVYRAEDKRRWLDTFSTPSSA